MRAGGEITKLAKNFLQAKISTYVYGSIVPDQWASINNY